MTYEQLTLPICRNVNVTASDFRARVSALAESVEVSQIHEALYSLKSCGWLKNESLKYFSQKMLLDFLTTMGGGTFGTIITTMAELGYSVEWQVLNSKDFGVPQHRQRVFIIGHLGNGSGREVFPVRAYGAEAVELQGQRLRNRVVSNTLTDTQKQRPGTFVADRQTDRCSSRSMDSTRIRRT